MKPACIVPYSPYSHGAKLLGKALGLTLVQRGYDAPAPGFTVINWGCGHPITSNKTTTVYNHTKAVATAVEKLSFFKKMAKDTDGPRIPPFTTSPEEALVWAKAGKTVMARTITEGKGGEGILFYEEDNLTRWMQAPLFVEFILNIAEYRMHFAFGKHIYTQKKLLSDEARAKGNVDLRVRSHKQGFFFYNEEIALPPDVIEQGTKAYRASGLDFCALDIVYNRYYDKAYVLEANTAPGLDEGKTGAAYVAAFREVLDAPVVA